MSKNHSILAHPGQNPDYPAICRDFEAVVGKSASGQLRGGGRREMMGERPGLTAAGKQKKCYRNGKWRS